MTVVTRNIFVLAVGVALPLWTAAAPNDELDQLRQDNASLRKQIEEIRNACVVAPAQAAPPAASSTGAAPIASPAAVIAAQQTPPAGYQLVKIKPVAPYSDTGCRKGTKSIDPRWKRKGNWDALTSGMTMADVEELLGVEHYDVAGNGRVGWEYGKCEAAVHGRVVFEDGVVQSLKKPGF